MAEPQLPFVLPVGTAEYRGPAAMSMLSQQLQMHADFTQLHRIATPQELQLDPTGLVAGQYRFDAHAFRDYANVLAPGLSRPLLAHLRDGDGDLATTYATVAAVMNRLAITRPNRVHRHKMLVDRRRNVIVGFMGQKYRWLKNHVFWELVQQQLGLFPGQPQLFEARLVGRQLSICCVGKSGARVGPNTLLRGIWATNGETGDRAVKLSPVLFDLGARVYAIGVAGRACTVVHTGERRFAQKLMGAFGALQRQLVTDVDLRQAMQAAIATNASLIRVDGDWARQVDNLTRYLRTWGVTASAAKDAAQAAIKPRGSTTRWEVFLACCKTAQARIAGDGLYLRHAAYDYLLSTTRKTK